MTTPAPAPSAPVITSAVFDQPDYVTGETINVTLTYVPGTTPVTQTWTGNVTDETNGLTGELVANFIVIKANPTTASGTDNGNRTWNKISDTGTVAIFQSIA